MQWRLRARVNAQDTSHLKERRSSGKPLRVPSRIHSASGGSRTASTCHKSVDSAAPTSCRRYKRVASNRARPTAAGGVRPAEPHAKCPLGRIGSFAPRPDVPDEPCPIASHDSHISGARQLRVVQLSTEDGSTNHRPRYVIILQRHVVRRRVARSSSTNVDY